MILKISNLNFLERIAIFDMAVKCPISERNPALNKDTDKRHKAAIRQGETKIRLHVVKNVGG